MVLKIRCDLLSTLNTPELLSYQLIAIGIYLLELEAVSFDLNHSNDRSPVQAV